MTTTQNPNSFDCIKFKRDTQSQIYDEIKNLSLAEQLAYFKKRSEEGALGTWWKCVMTSV